MLADLHVLVFTLVFAFCAPTQTMLLYVCACVRAKPNSSLILYILHSLSILIFNRLSTTQTSLSILHSLYILHAHTHSLLSLHLSIHGKTVPLSLNNHLLLILNDFIKPCLSIIQFHQVNFKNRNNRSLRARMAISLKTEPGKRLTGVATTTSPLSSKSKCLESFGPSKTITSTSVSTLNRNSI